MRALSFLAAVVALAPPVAWGAPIYRWVDASGVTQYSDVPPRGMLVDALDGPPPTEAPVASPPDWAKVEEDFRARQSAREPASVPGGTLAQPVLQKRIFGLLLRAEQELAPQCNAYALLNTEVLSRDADGLSVVERWTVDRCGTPVSYRVDLVPYQPLLRGRLLLDENASIAFTLEPPGAR